MIEFFMPMIPPTVTHQEHEVAIRNNKPVFFDPPELKAARQKLMDHVGRYAPPDPLSGPLRLMTKWIWPVPEPTAKEARELVGDDWAIYKQTKPDTDNIIKLLKDCMTRCRFWHDDAQVASEITEKFLGLHPGIYVRIEAIDPWQQ